MRNISLVFLALIVFACGPGKKSDEQAFLDSLDNLTLDAPMISEEVIADIIQQVPSPLEISYLLIFVFFLSNLNSMQVPMLVFVPTKINITF